MVRRTILLSVSPTANPAGAGGRLRRPAAVNRITVALIAFMLLLLYVGSVAVVGYMWKQEGERVKELEAENEKEKRRADTESERARDLAVQASSLSEQLQRARNGQARPADPVGDGPPRGGDSNTTPFPDGGSSGLLEDAVEFYRRVLQAQVTSPEVQREVARLYLWNAGFYYRARQLDKAEELCNEAIQLLKKVSAQQPDIPDHRQELARAYSEHGNIVLALGDPKRSEDARRAWIDGLTIQQQLVKDYPAVPTYRQQLAEMYGNLGVFLQDSRQRRDFLERARKELEALKTEFPKIHEYRSQLGVALANLAFAQSEAGLYKEADANMTAAMKLQREAVDANPGNMGYRDFLLKHYFLKADMLLRHRGAYDQVVKTIDEIMQMIGPKYFPDFWSVYYEATVYYVRCRKLVAEDTKLSVAQRNKLTNLYTVKAVSMLRQAHQKGYVPDGKQMKLDPNLVKRLQDDPELDPLRSDPAFKEMLKEIGLKS
jgi:tetratricopeptide (TPR) repeat protein